MKSFQSIPKIYDVRLVEGKNYKTFHWLAENEGVFAHGFISLDYENPENIELNLTTGSMNSYRKESVEYGRIVLDDIYYKLKQFCPNIPEQSLIKEECIRVCD